MACAVSTSFFFTCLLGLDGTGGVAAADGSPAATELTGRMPEEVRRFSAPIDGRAGTAGDTGGAVASVGEGEAVRRLRTGVPCTTGAGGDVRGPAGSVMDMVFDLPFLRCRMGDFEGLLEAMVGGAMPAVRALPSLLLYTLCVCVYVDVCVRAHRRLVA